MFDHGLTIRLDKNTNDLLNQLKDELSLPSKADAFRKSLKLMDKLLQLKKLKKEIIVRSRNNQEEKLMLIDI